MKSYYKIDLYDVEGNKITMTSTDFLSLLEAAGNFYHGSHSYAELDSAITRVRGNENE